MKEITNLVHQIEEHYWAEDYVRRPELGEVVDDYLAKKDFTGAEVTYGDYGYRAVYPDKVIDGEIVIDYSRIEADKEKDGHLFLDECSLCGEDDKILRLEYDGDESAVGYIGDREVGSCTVDISHLKCEESDVRHIGTDTSCPIPVYSYRDTLVISGRLGFNEGEFIRQNAKSLRKEGWKLREVN